jgi:DNA invertase Pin-like site-specific DNA recombinase
MLYVRQSSAHQVMHCGESRRLQYAMKDRLRQLGWQAIEMVDDDLGRSAAGGHERRGFERMVAEVCLGKVGAVAAREVSRFARNSRDWQQLVEVCRVVDTLLIDHETIYDPRRGNDRLMLGLKGSLNEYELDILRLRSVEARHAKARRGELIVTAPVGYLKGDAHGLVKDPDRRVQEALRLIFRKCLELGSARQTLLWFIEQGLELPSRRHGAGGWETTWKRPSYSAMLRILQSPVYAGFYAYGKTEVKVEFRDGVSRKTMRRRPMDEWLSLLPDRHEAYVSRDRFERIQKMIANNILGANSSGPGAPKNGPALLTGLLRCGRCGRKLTVCYTGQAHNVQRYVCCRGVLDHGEPRCLGVGGRLLDQTVSAELLRVVQPGAIEAAIQAGTTTAGEQDDVIKALRLDLEAARFAAERAWKQFDAVDPANRLVADELERRWNHALQRMRELEEKVEREESRLMQLQPPAPRTFESLAADFGRVWHDPPAEMRLRKRLARALIEEVVVDVDAEAGEVILIIHWQGGLHTERRFPRRRRGQSSAQTSTEIVEAVRAFVLICPDDYIANTLNRNGLRTGRGNRWTRERVTSLRSKRRIAVHSPERKAAEGWMNLTQAAHYLGVSPKTLRLGVERGQIQGRHPLPDGPWILKREHLDQPEARRLIERVRQCRANPAGLMPGQLSLFESIT